MKNLLKIGTEKNQPKHNSLGASQKVNRDKPSVSKLSDNKKVDVDGSKGRVNSVKVRNAGYVEEDVLTTSLRIFRKNYQLRAK